MEKIEPVWSGNIFNKQLSNYELFKMYSTIFNVRFRIMFTKVNDE